MTTPPTGPTGPVAPGPDPRDAGRRRHRTGWIVAVVILGLAVISLLIWALSTQSDLDSANTTIEAQQQAAEKAGMNNKQRWADIESGRRANVTMETLGQIATALGKKSKDLLK